VTATKHVLGSFRLATGQRDAPETLAGMPADLRKLLWKNPSAWKSDERAGLARYFLTSGNQDLVARFKVLDEDRASLAALPSCNLLIMRELTGKDVRTTRVFHRGNWLDKDEVVEAATPTILNPWPARLSAQPTRLRKMADQW